MTEPTDLVTDPQALEAPAPDDATPQAPATGPYRVPASLTPLTSREAEPITVASLEAAGHWDARLWRRGPMPWR